MYEHKDTENRLQKSDGQTVFSCPSCHFPVPFFENEYVCIKCKNRPFKIRYGIPVFTSETISGEAAIQQQHYDKIAEAYVQNLSYPHTITYMNYLDDCLLKMVPKTDLGMMAELCCGKGEAISLFYKRFSSAVGIDISLNMLRASPFGKHSNKVYLAQGDATELPLPDNSFDHVVMLGGIHHINQREKLFNEIHRILRPGGYFIFREPVDDFLFWRFIRKLIYRMSPMLDHETERPLRYEESKASIERAGLRLTDWKTFGFFGFCFFMNSDVLFFNRFFRFFPFIEKVTQFSTWVDHKITETRFMRKYGLIAIGLAQKPKSPQKTKEILFNNMVN